MTALTPKAAAAMLNCAERSVWRLLQRGTLQRADGHGVRITAESLAAYRTKKSTDNLLTGQWNCQKDSEFNQDVARILKLVPALSEPAAAAKRLGIPTKTFERLVGEGSVPILEIGSQKFIPGGWLAEQIAAAYARPAERKA